LLYAKPVALLFFPGFTLEGLFDLQAPTMNKVTRASKAGLKNIFFIFLTNIVL
jgi:hypothetical protein